MIFAPLFVLLVVGSGWWAWGYQQRVVRVLRQRPSSVEQHARRAAAAATSKAQASAPFDTRRSTPRLAVRQVEGTASRAPSSVLGWDGFSIVSTLVFDGTVLIGCRRQDHSRAVDRELSSLVLLIGEDERATQAVALLEGWRASTASLNLRPTAVAGAIELFDSRANALHAALLAD